MIEAPQIGVSAHLARTISSTPGMDLAVFDIDGTLIDSTGLDDALYVRAFREAFGIEGIDADWSAYRESTDSGIGAEVIERHLGRPARDEDLGLHRRLFAALWKAALARGDVAPRPIPGALALLEHLSRRPGWTVAVATGGWMVTAQAKLDAVGVDPRWIAGAAFADDSPSRVRIIETAIGRSAAAAARGGAAARRAVYVGDAVWDVDAAARAGVGFVGVGSGRRGQRLRDAGADPVLADFSDLDGAVAALSEALRPMIALST